MNVRENYLTALRGEKSEWIPHYGTDVVLWSPEPFNDPYNLMYGLMYQKMEAGESIDDLKATDGWGITWMLDQYGPITAPGGYVMDDICDWQEKFNFPNLDAINWDMQIQDDTMFVDREKVFALCVWSPFSTMVNAMGFANALMGIAGDTDETIEFCEKLTSYYCRAIRETLSRVKVDYFQLFEDLANADNTMISPDTYREVFKPFDKRIIDTVKEFQPDIPIEFHVCGKCEILMGDFVEIGCTAWQPAQPMNNLPALKKQYGLTIVGGWDNVGICSDPEQTEETVRQSVRDCIDTLSQGDGYIFWEGGAVGVDPAMVGKLEWANDEAHAYGGRPDKYPIPEF